MPLARLHGLAVDPTSCVGVTPDLVVLTERFGTDCPTGIEELLDFPQDQRVAFQRGGVVSLFVPDVVLDRSGLKWAGQATEALVQLLQCRVQPLVDRASAGASPAHQGCAPQV